MKIAVCIKHAVDESELKMDPGGSPMITGAAGKMGTFDKNAVEEAVRLKSSGGGDVTIFTVGPADARKSMKEGLAMGGDRGVLVTADPVRIDSLSVAGLLAKAVQRDGSFDLIICSEGSSDVYTGQVPPMLAELLGFAYFGYAKKLEVSGSRIRVERSLEESVEVVEAPLPAVVSVVSEINEPRYPTLIQIMQAAKKPLEEVPPSALGVETAPKVVVRSMSGQGSNRKKVMLDGTPEEAAAKLVDALRAEGVIPR
ncbi:MAG: electron transfer flavoprotein subunit beta/FixA family protein [Thaumarchaeota archaeon]|nr:electron transfer flavoprotein subunit beta/FixA family protein [Nitrososphaerota archaeon]